MLRIAVISLFVANLLLFAFRGKEPPVPEKAMSRPAVVEDTGIPTIHLFSEMVQDQELMSDSRRCFSLGPFHSSEDLDEFRGQLEGVSARTSERQTQALVEKGFWVFLPPFESLLEANKVLFSLQALGLEDIAVIYQGEWENAVSMGYFLRQENAQRRKKGLEDRGYAPLIRVQRQAESRYWLDYEQAPGSVLITLDLQDRPNDFMQRSLPCPEHNPFETVAGVAEDLSENTAQAPTQNPQDDEGSEAAEAVEIDAEEITGEIVEEVAEETPEAKVETGPVAVDGPGTETGVETEALATENLADGNVQEQVQALEETDTALSGGVESAESADTGPVETDGPPSPSVVVTDPENGPETAAESAAETVDEPVTGQSPLENEAAQTAKSVGTGPPIGFEYTSNTNSDVEPELANEADTVDGEVKDPDKDEGTDPESDDGTDPNGD